MKFDLVRFTVLAGLAFAACLGASELPDERVRPDAGSVVDAGVVDASTDGGMESDAGVDSGVDSGVPDAGAVDAGAVDAGRPDAGIDAGVDAGRDSGCQGALLCEDFEGYDAGALANNARVGVWRTTVHDSHGTVAIDPSRSTSGTRSLKVHIDTGSSSGGQLRTTQGALFRSPRTKLFGRFWLFLGMGAGTSVHWTMFGASGTVPSGPTTGHHATYLYSAFPTSNNTANVFGDVYYDDQTAQDCWNNSPQTIPVGRWACVAWAIDGEARTYRFWLDGVSVPTMSVNNTGQGCVAHPAASPWYGPLFDEFYVGALSFHAMTAPLDLWVDDVVVDTNPVSCP